MNEEKSVKEKSVTMVVGALCLFGSLIVYAQTTIEKVESRQKEEIKERTSEIQKQIEKETQERQALADQLNKKLDTIITILATGRSTK